MSGKIKVDRAGVAALLKSQPIRDMTENAAEKIADRLREQAILVGALRGGRGQILLPVTVETSVTDRAEASVLISHPAGKAVQAKYGALTRAASAVGLTVRGS